MRRRQLLSQGDFRWLLAASTSSGIGDWLYNVGLVTVVWEQTHSVGWLAVVEVIALGGSAVLAASAGALADRIDRRRLMIAADLASAAVMLALALGRQLGLGVWFTAADVLLLAVVSAPQVPAVVAFTPELVPNQDLAHANALISAGEHVALAAGPAMGALVLVVGPPSMTFVANAVSFIASAAFIAKIRARPPMRHTAAESSSDGFGDRRAAIRSSGLSPMLLFWIATGVLFGLEAVVLPVAAERLFGIGIDGYGWLLAAFGLGGLVAIPASRNERIGTTIVPAAIALCLIAAPFATLATVRNPGVACAAWAVAGFGTAIGSVIHDTMVQRRIDRAMVGGVAGAFEALYLSAIVVGSLLAPLLVDVIGVRGSLAVPGLLVACLALGVLPWARREDQDRIVRSVVSADRSAGSL